MNKLLKTWLQSLKQEAEPDWATCLQMLGGHISLLRDYADTPQDPIWHAEGDVAIHTDWVLQALYRLLRHRAKHLSGAKRQALILGALLHDIGKPLTTKTKEIDGAIRWVAPHHEAIGRSYLVPLLADLQLEYEVAQWVLGLVGYHQVPKRLVHRNAPKAEYDVLACNADCELLYWLETADMQGRTCPDKEQQLAYLEEFKLFCQEYDLWQNLDAPWQRFCPDGGVDNITKQQLYRNNVGFMQLCQEQIHMPEEALASTYSAAQDYPQLLLCCGISGSGKSSWIAKHLPHAVVISLDDLRESLNGGRDSQKRRGQVLQQAKIQLKQALASKQTVVWDATNLRQDFRSALFAIGKDYGALVTLLCFWVPLSCLQQRNQSRRHPIPDSVLQRQLSALQWPQWGEAHRLAFIDEQGQVLGTQGHFASGQGDINGCQVRFV